MRRAAALLLLSLIPFPALAVGQGETALSGGPGLAILLDGETRVGGAADLRLVRGLSDAWSARLGLEAVRFSGRRDTPTAYLAPGLGLTVAADILNLVPFADAGLIFVDIRATGVGSQQHLGGQLTLGADYLVSRHLTLSLLGHVDYFPLRLAGPRGSRPLLLTFALHLGYVF